MSRDRIFMIEPGFEDPKRPGERFVCPHCNAIEGLLAAFPDLAARLDIHRVPVPRPRLPVVRNIAQILAAARPNREEDWDRDPYVSMVNGAADEILVLRSIQSVNDAAENPEPGGDAADRVPEFMEPLEQTDGIDGALAA